MKKILNKFQQGALNMIIFKLFLQGKHSNLKQLAHLFQVSIHVHVAGNLVFQVDLFQPGLLSLNLGQNVST